MDKEIKLYKPSEDMPKDDNCFRLKVINSIPKSKEDINQDIIYLDEFFQMYDCISKTSSNDEDIIILLFSSAISILKCKIELFYENQYLKYNPVNQEYIRQKDSEFLIEIKDEIEKHASLNRSTTINNLRIQELINILQAFPDNIVKGNFYCSKYLYAFEYARSVFLNQQFSLLHQNGMYLGTKSPSKDDINSINSKIAECYYNILCCKDMQSQFLGVLEGTTDIRNADKSIKLLFRRVPLGMLQHFRSNIINRSAGDEALLILYIIVNRSASFRTEDLLKYFSDDEIEEIKYSSMYAVDENKDNMLLSRKVTIVKDPKK